MATPMKNPRPNPARNRPQYEQNIVKRPQNTPTAALTATIPHIGRSAWFIEMT